MAAGDMETFIHHLPKAELHVHLEGCLTPGLAQTLADRNNMPLPDSVRKASTSTGFVFHDLTSFLAVYYPAMAVLQTSQDFHDLAWDYLSRAHAQNVRHVELFFDPQAHTSRGVAFGIVIGGFRQALLRAEREFSSDTTGFTASLIMCFLRDMSAEFAMATLLEGLQYRDWIVGVGLDSDERGHPPEKFAAVFERARKEGWMVTCHCDIDQPGSVQNIRTCVRQIAVDRLDHATNVVEDETLLEEVRTRGIGLTTCPISNSVVTGDFKSKEIVGLLRRGVKVTINGDDPAYFRGYVSENLLKMANEAGVSKHELVILEKNAFEVSWVSNWRKAQLLQELEVYARRNDVVLS